MTDNAVGEQLLLCPFCPDGGDAYLNDMMYGSRVYDIAVRCRRCGCSSRQYGRASGISDTQDARYEEARQSAVIAWNTRAAPSVATQDEARELLITFMNTISEGESEYSCNECELNTYLCPHLFDRLAAQIATSLSAQREAGYREGIEDGAKNAQSTSSNSA